MFESPCLSVSVSSRCSTKTSRRIELVFWHGCFLRPFSYTVLQGNSGTYKITLSFWEFVLTSALKYITTARRSSQRVANAAALVKGGRSERDKQNRRR